MLVELTAGHSMFSFTNGFSGYDQIKVDPVTVENVFWTLIGNCLYLVMLFGLKNIGAIINEL